MSIGILKVEYVGFAVRKASSHRHLLGTMGFEDRGSALCAGHSQIRYVEPKDDGFEAQFLGQHPDGVAVIAFQVKNLEEAAAALLSRGATLMTDITIEVDGSRQFDIATPVGSVVFRFIEECSPPCNPQGRAAYGIDHFTCHFLSMAPAIWWFEQVMGFSRYWNYHFHTRDSCTAGDTRKGTGMSSQVMRDSVSGITFALNEPRKPDFGASQVAKFVRANRGPGVQHIALATPNLCGKVKELGVPRFLTTPACYYDAVAQGLHRCGPRDIREDIRQLQSLGILVDGEAPGKYLLQIFMRPLSDLLGDDAHGPFFFEFIERRGAKGFGEGNFRSLFEAIERSQQTG